MIINRHQHWGDETLELSSKDFKTFIIKIIQGAITNILETNEKVQSLKKTNRRYKGKTNSNFRTINYNQWNKKTQFIIKRGQGNSQLEGKTLEIIQPKKVRKRLEKK